MSCSKQFSENEGAVQLITDIWDLPVHASAFFFHFRRWSHLVARPVSTGLGS